MSDSQEVKASFSGGSVLCAMGVVMKGWGNFLVFTPNRQLYHLCDSKRYTVSSSHTYHTCYRIFLHNLTLKNSDKHILATSCDLT